MSFLFDPELAGTVVVDVSLLQAACNELRRYAIPAGSDDQVVLNLEAIITHKELNIPSIVIEGDNVCITRVVSTTPIQFVIHDEGTEGCDVDELAVRPDLDGNRVEVYARSITQAEVNEPQVMTIIKAIKAEGGRDE
ncbi:hypothetical protein [Eoetvoesiella caeni]